MPERSERPLARRERVRSADARPPRARPAATRPLWGELVALAALASVGCGSAAGAETSGAGGSTAGGDAPAHGHHHGGATGCHERAHHAGHGGGDAATSDDAAGSHDDFTDVECFARMFDAPERDAWQRPDEVVALLLVTPGLTVADLGAGTGYFEARLDAAVGEGGHVLALDVEPAMVEHMRARFERDGLTRTEARVVSPDDPALAPGSVDRVLVVDTWHHIAARQSYAARLAAALRPGGFVLVVDFTAESPEGPPAAMRLTAEACAAELGSAGLVAEVLDETLPHQWVVRARRMDE